MRAIPSSSRSGCQAGLRGQGDRPALDAPATTSILSPGQGRYPTVTCESNAIKLDFPAQEIFEGLKKYWSIYRRLSFADTDCSHEIVFYYCCRDGKYNKRSPNSSAANETTDIALSRIIIAQVAPPPPPGSHTSRIQVLQCIQTTTGIHLPHLFHPTLSPMEHWIP